MKITVCSMLLCLLLNISTYAQKTILTIKILEEITGTPLMGVTIYFESLGIGSVTNFDGSAILKDVPLGKQALKISHMGYETIIDTLQISKDMPLIIYKIKAGGMELEGITIKTTRSSRTIKNTPTRVEFIGAEELGEKAMMNSANISMVLRESTGIQMQQTSLSSVNTSIRIQGLDGRYTQLLKDGFPLYNSFSGGLSIMQIPPLDLRQFEIVKGSSSTLYGGGAIAGLVNMVSKRPDEGETPELDVMATQTQAGGSAANVFYSKRKGKWGCTIYGSGNYQRAYDPDDDDFSNLPDTRTISFNSKIFYYPSENQTLWLGINGTYDWRKGGDMTAIRIGKNGMHQYLETNTSERFSTQVVYEKKLSKERYFQLKNSVSLFDRKLETSDTDFSGKQWDVFFEGNYAIKKDKMDWIVGGNFYSNTFTEKETTLPRNQSNQTVGVFANNTMDISDNFILEAGFRSDYSPDWGVFPLPRLSLLWKSKKHFSSRLGGGLGYKIPNMFTEKAATLNYKDILPIDKDKLVVERSYGGNIDFNYSNVIFDTVSFSINQLFYLTSIDKALLLNPLANGKYLFENADGQILSRGTETNIKFIYEDFRWFLNCAYINATLNYLPNNPQKILTPKYQAGSVWMYENDKWRIGYELYYTGSQRLSYGVRTTDFFTMGLLLQKHFKWGSPYINFENFTDRRQSRFSPETLPPHYDPNFAEIYAPTDGFIFTVGVLIRPFESD